LSSISEILEARGILHIITYQIFQTAYSHGIEAQIIVFFVEEWKLPKKKKKDIGNLEMNRICHM